MASERDRKIRERAYELWVQGGQRDDTSEQNWHQAEQEYAAGSESPDLETAAAPKKASRGKAAAPETNDTAAKATRAKAAPVEEAPAKAASSKSASPQAASTKAGSGKTAPTEGAATKAPRGKPPAEAEKPAVKRATKSPAKTTPAS